MEKQPVEPSAAPTPVIKQLEYDTKSGLITRRQMRFFLLLLTINTILFAAFICLPSVSPFLKQMWTDYQARRETEREAAKLHALIDACLNYSEGADKLVYADPPADAAKLLSQAGRSLTVDQLAENQTYNAGNNRGRQDALPREVWKELIDAHWQPPAFRGRCQALVDFDAAGPPGFPQMGPTSGISDQNVVFLHAMATPSGSKRLVWIAMQPLLDYKLAPDTSSDREYQLQIRRIFNAHVFDADSLNANSVHTTALLSLPTSQPNKVTIKSDGTVQSRPSDQWRIFAGQPDRANSSHLTIAYDIDGKPGVIDGWLKEGDRLMLEPRTGRLVTWNSGSEYTWDLSSTATTQPTK